MRKNFTIQGKGYMANEKATYREGGLDDNDQDNIKY